MKTQFTISILFLFVLSVSADSVKMKELQKQKDDVNKRIEFLGQEIGRTDKNISQGLDNLTLLNEKIKTTRQLLYIISEETKELNNQISIRETHIKQLEKELKGKKENYAISIRKIHKHKRSYNQFLFILASDDFAQSLRRILYLKEYSSWQKVQAEEIIQQQELLYAEKQELEKNKKEKIKLVVERQNEEAKLKKEEESQKLSVANLRKNSKSLQAELAKKKKEAVELEKAIDKIIQEEIEASRKKAEAKPGERKSATPDGYAMTKEEQSLADDFASNKGKLPFPIKGQYSIIGRFGQQNYEALHNVVGHNLVYDKNGIEIKTTKGNSAKSVFDGEVTLIFHIPGSQTSVIVRHGNYITLYSYLETIFVKKGDKVKTGQDIGEIYHDVNKGTVLYFEIRQDKTKLNPEHWLYK
ncbi:septal ring factor EnvC (AmiA/AmiB activator) [Dysgonomonadaceae bacterium PH5-43]|nr:septal ring factor EnvC (AmiA/AmiB activator) [Dysgonomonadaceae bacterium PH5-43]